MPSITNTVKICNYFISDSRREVDEICVLIEYYVRVVVIPYRRFGTTYRFHFKGSRNRPFNIEPIGFPETSVMNYFYTLSNISEDRK